MQNTHATTLADKRPASTLGRLIGQKAPLKLKEIWAIRTRLQLAGRARDLALFNLAIDSKLRGCDLVKLRVLDIQQNGRVLPRVNLLQQKTGRPVQFEITPQTRDALAAWIAQVPLKAGDYLFPSRIHKSPHITTRQYGNLVRGWVQSIGLDPTAYGTHSMRRTKATLIYRQTKTCGPYNCCSAIPKLNRQSGI